jgi:transcriptional regulator with XRE-family HTH domain
VKHSQNIRDLRVAMGLTQRQVAELSGVPQREISRIETGGNFYVQDVRAVANALNISFKELVGLGV